MSNTEYYWYFGNRLIPVSRKWHVRLFKMGFLVGQVTEVSE